MQTIKKEIKNIIIRTENIHDLLNVFIKCAEDLSVRDKSPDVNFVINTCSDDDPSEIFGLSLTTLKDIKKEIIEKSEFLDSYQVKEFKITLSIDEPQYSRIQINAKHGDFNWEDNKIEVKVEKDGNEQILFCKSRLKSKKEISMKTQAQERFEKEIENIKSSLTKERGIKKYEKIIERIGRAKGKYSSIAKYCISPLIDKTKKKYIIGIGSNKNG